MFTTLKIKIKTKIKTEKKVKIEVESQKESLIWESDHAEELEEVALTEAEEFE